MGASRRQHSRIGRHSTGDDMLKCALSCWGVWTQPAEWRFPNPTPQQLQRQQLEQELHERICQARVEGANGLEATKRLNDSTRIDESKVGTKVDTSWNSTVLSPGNLVARHLLAIYRVFYCCTLGTRGKTWRTKQKDTNEENGRGWESDQGCNNKQICCYIRVIIICVLDIWNARLPCKGY